MNVLDSGVMRRPAARVATVAALAAIALVVWALGLPYGTAGNASAPILPGLPADVTVDVQGPVTPVPRSFLGLSTEYWTLPIWERHMASVDRVLAAVHVPSDPPLVLRVGGDSADDSIWMPAGREPPDWAFELDRGWLTRTATLVDTSGVRLILDLNLVTATPAIAADWASAATAALPRHSVVGLEVGNEPDLYTRANWMAVVKDAAAARSMLPPSITPRGYSHDFAAYARALSRAAPGVPLLGPALANPQTRLSFVRTLLARPHPALREVTVHRYPYSQCAFPGTRAFATIHRVLSDQASAGVARSVRPAVVLAHRAGLPLRMTELNSVTCGGHPGVSNAFATALWAPDTLFDLIRAGVSAADIHVRAYTVNAAFAFTRRGLRARPLLYGLILFTHTLGHDARLVPVHIRAPRAARLHVWAVRVGRASLHVLIIDKGHLAVRVALRLPGRGPAAVQRLTASSVSSRTGETLGGQTLDAAGRWHGRAAIERIVPHAGVYRVFMPRAGAALLWLRLPPRLATARRSRSAPPPPAPVDRRASSNARL